MKDLFAAFVKAQAAIEKASKDKANPHFRSKYADLGNVVDAIKPALEANGLGFIQKFHDDEKAIKVETIIVHESGENFSCGVLSIPVTKQDAQGFGSACTYARRYSLQAAFGVAPDDDDGNAAAKAAPKRKAGVITPNDGAFDGLSQEEAQAAVALAATVQAKFDSGKEYGAWEEWSTRRLGDEGTRAAWNKIDSKARAYIKERAAEEKKSNTTQEEQ